MARQHIDIRLTPEQREQLETIATQQKINPDDLATSIVISWLTESASRAKKPTRRGHGIGMNDFEEIVCRAIMKARRPLDLAEIITAIHESGRQLHGDTREARERTAVRKLAETKHVVRISGAGYWLREVDCPTVSYTAKKGTPRDG